MFGEGITHGVCMLFSGTLELAGIRAYQGFKLISSAVDDKHVKSTVWSLQFLEPVAISDPEPEDMVKSLNVA